MCLARNSLYDNDRPYISRKGRSNVKQAYHIKCPADSDKKDACDKGWEDVEPCPNPYKCNSCNQEK